GLVRGRHHDHRARQALFSEVILYEFLHLAAAFANQSDHRDVGIDIARQHRQQYRLADAGAGEDAEPLAAATGHKGIERPHAEIERRADAFARMRRRRRIAIGYRRGPRRQRPLAVDRLAHRVEDAAEPQWRRPHLTGGIGDDGPAAAPDAL